MSIVGRETMVTSPHQEIDQHEFEDRHDVVFGVVEFIHGTFLFVESL